MAWTFYTDEQKALCESYREASAEHIAGRVEEIDKTGNTAIGDNPRPIQGGLAE